MKILLNCLPPHDNNTPNMAFSILKKFMLINNVETSVKYWNFDLSLMTDYTDSEDPEKRMLHFLSILNDREGNDKGKARIIELMQDLKPVSEQSYLEIHSENLEVKKSEVLNVIHRELQNIDFSEISLIGISAKYYQWIPGIILAEEIKKISPDTKIVVGGFGTKEAANEAMNLCSHFDYATWGEGEYPLLNLYQQISAETSDLNLVPRLLYREGEGIKQSTSNRSDYLDFKNYPYPNFDDFMDAFPFTENEDEEYDDDINFPINTIRSCHWRKCNFCDFNSGYKLRSRTPEDIVGEIEYIIDEYGITTFSFVDSDTFGNLHHFEELLDLIIELKYRNEEDLSFWAEIIPNQEIDSRIMKKMAIAGFKNLFIGYDGLSDTLLSKMSKRNTFSDNIFFVKESIKYAISPIVNVIRFVPSETKEDVLECQQNLHFLRFLYNDSVVKFEHIFVDLVLSSSAKYYSMLSEIEREKYIVDDLTYLMPKRFSEGESRFHLFRFKHETPANINVWEQLAQAEKYYKENHFSYTLLENKGVYYYTEYCNDIEIENIIFGEPEYGQAFEALEGKVYSFKELYQNILKVNHEITEDRLREVLSNLRESYLVYFDLEFNGIVGVVGGLR